MAGDFLKDIYFGLEEKYYHILEKIDTVIPILKVVDAVDRVVPSFAIVLLVIALLIIFGAYILLSGFVPLGTASLEVQVTDAEGSGLPNALVKLTYGGETTTLATDNFGNAKFSVPTGTDIMLEVQKEGFEAYSEQIKLSNSETRKIVLEALEADKNDRKIRLVDSFSGQTIIGEASVSFECSNSKAVAPADVKTTTGELTVTVPTNCGTLTATIKSQRYKEISIPISGSLQTIQMEELESVKSTITVTARDKQSQEPLAGIEIGLFEFSLGPIDSELTDALGKAVFKASPGRYTVTANDPKRVYGTKSSAEYLAEGGKQLEIPLELEKNISGKLSVKVIDAGTKQPVYNAKITLKKQGNVIQALSTLEENTATVEFDVVEFGAYTIFVDHPNYLIEERELSVNTATASAIIELSRFTGTNAATLKVRVVDELGKAVENARVALYDAETGMLTGHELQVSDLNGIARFERTLNGRYKAFAFKAAASGWSDEKFFSIREAENFYLNATMVIGNGTVRARAVDSEQQPIGFAQVKIFNSYDSSLIGSGYTDSNGIFLMPAVGTASRADKEVFVQVQKKALNTGEKDYASYTTVSKQIIANTVQDFSVVLEPKILQGEIKILFKGLYFEGKLATNPSAGKQYVAKFQIRVPEEKEYNEIGAHIRVGTQEILEKDVISLKELNAPNTTKTKGTSFSPARGESYDFASATAGNAKWINAKWEAEETIDAGIYELEATIEIKGNASVADELKLFYRAWAYRGGSIARDPVDARTVQDLYAQTYVQLYQVGATTLCDEGFCFDATIFDEKEKLSEAVTDSYSARVFASYRLNFNISNNSETKIHDNAEIRIENPGNTINFSSYTFYNAQGQEFKGSPNSSSIPSINVGNLNPGNKVSGTLYFKPTAAATDTIVFRIVSDYAIAFDKSISIISSATREIALDLQPAELAAGVENTLQLTAKDSVGGVEIEAALVKVIDRFGTVLVQGKTSRIGKLSLVVPAQQPGTKLLVTVEKEGYLKKEIILTATKELLEFTPQRIGVSLNTTTKRESQNELAMKNISSFSLAIESIELVGNFQGLLQKEQINSWLHSYEGIKIEPGSQQELTLRTMLSNEALSLAERQSLEGVLAIDAAAYSQKWHFEVPVQLAIGLGAELDDPSCLKITRTEWNVVTEGEVQELEFEVQNNCTSGGQPVPLYNLQVQSAWSGNETAELTMALYDGENAVGAAQIRQGYYKTLLNFAGAEKAYSARLLVTPYGGVYDSSEITVTLKALNRLESGDQEIIAQMHITASVLNLKDCVSFSKELIFLEPNKPAGFTISTKDCGGPVTFALKSEIELSNSSITLGATAVSPEIIAIASNKNLGQYPIEVKALFTSERTERQLKMLRARIFDPTACIQLNRYEFDVFDDPNIKTDGFDTAELYNNCYEKDAKATIDERDWKEAIKDGIKWGIIGYISGWVSQWGQGKGSKSDGKGGGFLIWLPWLTPETLAEMCKEGATISSAGVDYECRDGKWVELSETTSGKLPATGFASGSRDSGIFGDLLGGAIDGLLGQMFGKTPAGRAGSMFLIGTLLSYYGQGKTTINVIQPDIEISRLLMLDDKGANEDTDIAVEVVGNPELKQLAGTKFDAEIRKLELEKKNLQLSGTFFRTMDVKGARHFYDEGEVYKQDLPARLKEEAGSPRAYTQKFHLQFNSINPEEVIGLGLPPIAVDCISFSPPGRTGSTGAEALPKTKLAWNWNEIDVKDCEQGNPNAVYCDATQFSITVLKKVHFIEQFLSANAGLLRCPSKESVLSTKTNAVQEDDIGISKLYIKKTASDANVIVEITNNNNPVMLADLQVKIMSSETSEQKTCTKQGLVVPTKIEAGCSFEGLADAAYAVEARITPNTGCENCLNARTDNDLLVSAFTIGEFGIEECEPYNTERLGEFIDETEQRGIQLSYPAGYNRTSFLELINFKAYLMKDGYTPDFQADFDEFSRKKSFFNAPSYYTENSNGLGQYFKDFSKFKFGRKGLDVPATGYALPGAGVYDVTINISFEEAGWQMFNAGMPNAKIKIELEKADVALEKASPFYSLPFDGLVGVDSANGRIGYGVNYSGSALNINSNLSQRVTTTEIPGSIPVEGAVLEAELSDSFKQMNASRTDRGLVLKLGSGATGYKLQFLPSYATPVILKLTHTASAGDSYGFYNFGINGADTYTGASSNPWWGIGANCRDFEGRLAREAFEGTYDVSGISAKCAETSGLGNTYGVEFCAPLQKSGNTYLKTVFYTPQNKGNLLNSAVYKEDMLFIAETITGKTEIPLNGVSGIKYNNTGSRLESVEDVFNAVKSRAMCVSGSGTEFWWNPKPVLNVLAQKEKAAEADCIAK